MEKKEAIKILKDFYDKSALFSIRAALDIVIPELKESEGEKIRGAIIDHLKDNNLTEWAAWLERQSEQKPAWRKEDNVMLGEIIDFFENGTVKLQNDLSLYASWLKSLKGRYTWKPSEEQMGALYYMNLTGNISYVGQSQALMELYKDLKKLREE